MNQIFDKQPDAKMSRRGCRGGRRIKEKRDNDPSNLDHAANERPDSGIGSGKGSPEKDEDGEFQNVVNGRLRRYWLRRYRLRQRRVCAYRGLRVSCVYCAHVSHGAHG